MNDVAVNLLTIPLGATIETAFRQLNINKMGIVFVVDAAECIVGSLTDGDIRRHLLQDGSLSSQVSTCMNRHFVSARADASREQILKLLDRRIQAVPILDEAGRLVDVFTRDRFEVECEREVIARARSPVRISFSGGGTDLTTYFVDNGGAVINAAVALHAHATLRRREDTSVRIYSHDFRCEIEAKTVLDLTNDGNLDLIKSVVRLIDPQYGFDLEVSTDFPVGSGLGGSAVVAVAVIGCFNEFRSDKWDRHEIAEMAFQAERLMLNIPGGWQDQYATVFGGFNYMEFAADRNTIMPLRLAVQTVFELEESLVLCYTGKSHHSGEIHGHNIKALVGGLSAEAIAAAERQKEITREIKNNLLRGYLLECGRLLDEAWQAKRTFSPMATSEHLDVIYSNAKANGAVGGKLLGAGGGGYFLFFVEPFRRYSLIAALESAGLTCSRVRFEDAGLQTWKSRLRS